MMVPIVHSRLYALLYDCTSSPQLSYYLSIPLEPSFLPALSISADNAMRVVLKVRVGRRDEMVDNSLSYYHYLN